MEEQTDLICAGQDKTVLMYAIEGKLEPMCDKLIEMGADINAKDKYVEPLSRATHASGLQRLMTLCCLGMGCVWLNRRQWVSLLSLPPCSRTSATHSILT